MVDVGLRSGPNYGVVLRKTDGSQPIRLGEGSPYGLSPDGKWAAAIIAAPPRLVVYPTGPGAPIGLNVGPIERLISVEWFPDGRRLLTCGSERAGAPRCYAQDLTGSPPTPITPEGVLATLAPDGRTLLLMLQDGSWQASSIDGGPGRPVVALRHGDRHVAWSPDSRAVYVQRGPEVPAVVERVDLSTGARNIVRQLNPEGVGPRRRNLSHGLDRERTLVRLQLHEPDLDAVRRQRSDALTPALGNGLPAHSTRADGALARAVSPRASHDPIIDRGDLRVRLVGECRTWCGATIERGHHIVPKGVQRWQNQAVWAASAGRRRRSP